MTQARFTLDPYSKRVLDVVKGKYGLKTRNEALRKFVELHGQAHAEMNVDENILRDLDATYAEHARKHGGRKMGEKELDALLGL